MKVKNDHRSKFSNLSNWKEETWKIRASTGFEPVTSAIPVRCSTNWVACEQAHLFGWGAATESWREEWALHTHLSLLCRFSVPKQVSLLAGYQLSYEATHWKPGESYHVSAYLTLFNFFFKLSLFWDSFFRSVNRPICFIIGTVLFRILFCKWNN